MNVLISPSVLNADLTSLASEVERISNADMVHLDVMDNHFVPNLTFGLPVVEQIISATSLRADVHLMIEEPDRHALGFAEAGAYSVTFHAEASNAPIRLARELRKKGARAGIALKPSTAIEPYVDLLGEFDMVLMMTVEPGFGGQPYLGAVEPRIRQIRAEINQRGLHTWIQVDGGVSRETIGSAAAAGANVFVAGSAVYRAAEPAAEVAELRSIAQAAFAG